MPSFHRILSYILAEEDGLPKRPPLTDEELEIAAYLVDFGESVNKGDYQIFKEENISHFDDDSQDLSELVGESIYKIPVSAWTPEDEQYHKMDIYPDVVRVPGSPNMIQFERGDLVELTKVEEAVQYYGSKKGFHNNGSKIRPSLKCMKSKFRFIKEEHHLQKLREYEMIGCAKACRLSNLEFIAFELEKEVRKQIEQGKILHDAMLRFLIAGIIKQHKIIIDHFIGSDSWLLGWKKRFGVSSRKITKLVSFVRHRTSQHIEKDSQDFVNRTNQILPQYLPSSVYNADQSGFQLEMTTGRTLAFTGSKHVHCVVQSVSSTTHSYTVLPLIASDGTLHPKLFVTLKEKGGKFPKKGHFKATNLVVTCHTSHIMTKELMKEFFRTVVFDSSMPKDALLIVDGWSSWNDRAAIDSVTPPSNKLKVLQIPAGCTGHIQPCDVGIFGGFKKVVKTLTNYGQICNPEYRMQARDETLKFRPIQREREKPEVSDAKRDLMLELAQKRRKERKRKMNKDEEMEVDKPFTSGPQNTREGTSKEKKDDSSPPDDSGPGPSQVDPKWKYRGRPDSSDDEEDATSVKQTAHDESFLSKCKKNLEKVREWWRDVQILPFFRSTAECCREPTTHEYKPFVFDYATSSAPPSPDPSRPPSPQSKGSPIKRSDSESSLDSEFQSARDESSDDEEPMFPDASPNY